MGMDDKFPNREHYSAHVTAQRAALDALKNIRSITQVVEQDVLRANDPDRVTVSGSDVASMEDNVRRLGAALERLHVLSEVRGWHAADKAEQDQHMVRVETGLAEDGETETAVFMYDRERGRENYVGAARKEGDYMEWKPAGISSMTPKDIEDWRKARGIS